MGFQEDVVMNKLLVVILSCVLSFSVLAAEKDQQKQKGTSVIVKENKSVFKGLLYRVWNRLRTFSPQMQKKNTRKYGVATMGIRGAETTSTLIEPYWKGDKTDDPIYVKQLTDYTNAQQLAETGNLKGAVTALNEFIEDYSDSDLLPNAQFALGLSQGGLGEIDESIESLETFIDDNPNHPLVDDAKQVIAEFK